MGKGYQEGASSEAIRIRWISVQCYEIRLPNGKVIVTDPFFWSGDNLKGRGGADKAAAERSEGVRPERIFCG